MTSRLLSLVIWLAVAATATFWGLRLLARPVPVPAHAAVATPAPPQGGDLTRLFGAPPPPPPVAAVVQVPADSRFKLLGVVAPTTGQRQGLALISVEGRTPRAVGVGGRVDGELVLRSISHRRVELGQAEGPPSVVLELPALAEASRGALPPAQTEGGSSFVPPPSALPAPAQAVPRIVPGGMPPMRPAVPLPQVQPGIVPPQAAPFGVTPQPASTQSPVTGELPTR